MSRAGGLVLLFGLGIAQAGAQDGKLSALVYADYLYNVRRDTGLSNAVLGGEEGFNAFQFRRIYLTYDHAITGEFITRIRLEADETALTSDGKTGVFVKDAFLKWKGVFGMHDLIFGIQPTPSFELSEEAWGFRSLEKTIMDLREFAGSRDFGISLRGPLDPAGNIDYVVLIANGSGVRPERDKWKRIYARIGVRSGSALTISASGDFSARTDILNPYSGRRVGNSVLTGAGFVGFGIGEKVNVGVEGAVQTEQNGYDTGSALTDRTKLGLTAFVRWQAWNQVTFVGRFDFFDPNIQSGARNDTRGYVLGGIAWTPAPNVQIIPNIQVETFEATPVRSYGSSITGRLTLVWSTP